MAKKNSSNILYKPLFLLLGISITAIVIISILVRLISESSDTRSKAAENFVTIREWNFNSNSQEGWLGQTVDNILNIIDGTLKITWRLETPPANPPSPTQEELIGMGIRLTNADFTLPQKLAYLNFRLALGKYSDTTSDSVNNETDMNRIESIDNSSVSYSYAADNVNRSKSNSIWSRFCSNSIPCSESNSRFCSLFKSFTSKWCLKIPKPTDTPKPPPTASGLEMVVSGTYEDGTNAFENRTVKIPVNSRFETYKIPLSNLSPTKKLKIISIVFPGAGAKSGATNRKADFASFDWIKFLSANEIDSPKPTCTMIPEECRMDENTCRLPNQPSNGGSWCPWPTKPPCIPRPACLDAVRPCQPMEPVGGFCPTTPTPTVKITPKPSTIISNATGTVRTGQYMRSKGFNVLCENGYYLTPYDNNNLPNDSKYIPLRISDNNINLKEYINMTVAVIFEDDPMKPICMALSCGCEPGRTVISIRPAGITNYTCPPGEWVDCMPVVDPSRQMYCEKSYLDWAKINCPGFKGAAY